jgi:glycosyltransferase involved in cell wall biosynthesis
MKIAIDATIWQNKRGYGRHARSLLTALANLETEDKLTFFVDSAVDLDRIPSNVAVRHVSSSKPAVMAAASDSHRSFRDMWRMSRALSDPEFDVLFFPTVYSYVPVISRVPKVIMIHDVIAEKYPEMTVPDPKARMFWRMKVWIGRWQSKAIVTVSEYSRQKLVEHFGISEKRVFIVGEASDPVFRYIECPNPPQSLAYLGKSLLGRFLVYVGGFGPHKNLAMLLDVFASLVKQQEYADLNLIMVGEYRQEVFFSQFAELKQRIEVDQIQDRVIFTGYLPDEELSCLLNLAQALVLPSLMEGFGLPAVEAAACGCPVIATRESPLPYLLGTAGIYINPNDPADLRQALKQVLDSANQRRQMSVAGIEAASRLTWEAAGKQLHQLLHQVAGA